MTADTVRMHMCMQAEELNTHRETVNIIILKIIYSLRRKQNEDLT